MQASPAEIKVIVLILEGKSRKEAAQILRKSPKTINFHIGNFYGKNYVKNRNQLFAIARYYPIEIRKESLRNNNEKNLRAKELRAKGYSVIQIAAMLGRSRAQVYNYLKS